jgi:hypothetical protein
MKDPKLSFNELCKIENLFIAYGIVFLVSIYCITENFQKREPEKLRDLKTEHQQLTHPPIKGYKVQ